MISKKRTLLHLRNLFLKIRLSCSNNNSPQKIIFWAETFVQKRITTGGFTKESHSNFHVAYQTGKHWICPFNSKFTYESLDQMLSAIFVISQQKGYRIVLYRTRGESSLFAKEGIEMRLWQPFKEWWGTTGCQPLLVYAQQLNAIEVSAAGASW